MKQKQFLGVALGLVVLIVVITALFQFFVVKRAPGQMTANTISTQAPEKKETTTKGILPDANAPLPVPESVDGIVGSIQSESALDLTALDEEESGSLDEITKDSDSVTNLGTSYDEKSL